MGGAQGRLGSRRSESAGKQAGQPVLACLGRRRSRNAPPAQAQAQAQALPAASRQLLTWTLKPQLWPESWEMPGALLGGFSQGASEAAWLWGLAQW